MKFITPKQKRTFPFAVVAAFSSDDPTRHHLNMIHRPEGESVLVATNGHRMIVQKINPAAADPGDYDADKYLKTGELISADSPVTYPNWKQLIPTSNKHAVTFKVPAWVEHVKKSSNSVSLYLNKEGVLSTSETKDAKMAFNALLLREFAGETVEAKYNDEHSPMIIEREEVTIVVMPTRMHRTKGDN